MKPRGNTASCKVSVVIPCFNHGEFLPEAVASVTSIGRDDVELIVVDDGSTDGRTRVEMDNLAGDEMNVIRQENKGLAAARNAAIAASTGEYILPLDADNRLRSAYVEHGIRILEANPQAGVVYGDAQYMGTRTGRWHVGPFDLNRMLDCNYIDACAIYRRAIWEQNGGYDSTMPVQGYEDWDFWLGALEHGWQFAYVPEILFDYRVAPESMITRTRGSEAQIAEFVGRKHGHLYREAWSRLARERQSATKTSRRLRKLLRARLRQKLSKNPGNLWVNG
ncbi:MAG TPA: glycosyltransferase [Terriglobales bacterium]|nr:glycosyltransferase [Terriglobales bacterium]